MKKYVVAAVLPLALVAVVGAVQSQTVDIARWQQMSDAEFLSGAHLEDAEGVVPPRLNSQVSPKYTSEALRLKLQGTVTLKAIVMPDGTVARARVVKSLDERHGLDEEAVWAVLAWTFKPGTFNGQPAPVAAEIVMEFRIH